MESPPFTYLGLPLGTNRPSFNDLVHMVSILDKRFSCISSLMSYTRRLTLLNSVISTLPIYAMCYFEVPTPSLFTLKKVTDNFYGLAKRKISMENALLVGSSLYTKRGRRIRCIKSKSSDQSSLSENIQKFYNHLNIPWVNLLWKSNYNEKAPHAISPKGSFWWRDYLCLIDTYREMIDFFVKNGKSILLWKDSKGNIISTT
jgi:hypothetical protein